MTREPGDRKMFISTRLDHAARAAGGRPPGDVGHVSSTRTTTCYEAAKLRSRIVAAEAAAGRRRSGRVCSYNSKKVEKINQMHAAFKELINSSFENVGVFEANLSRRDPSKIKWDKMGVL